MYELIKVSTQGYSHIEKGQPCEDYGIVLETEVGYIFAVADGHGDSNCPRSQYGAEKACKIASEELKQFATDIAENKWEYKIIDNDKDADSVLKQLAISIIAKWIKTVISDIEEKPLSEEEKAGCDKYLDQYENGNRLEHVYGTTLTAGILTDQYLLLLSQGDGRCAVFHADGRVSEPIPWDEKCIANVTTSLCDEDAVQRTRFCVINAQEDSIIACLASSDGVEDSFANLDLAHAFFRKLLIQAGECGVRNMADNLQESLPDFSKNGSRDDVTICGFIDAEKAKSFTEVFEKENEKVEVSSIIKDLDDRIASINGMGKLDALKSKYESVQQEEKEAERILNEIHLEFEEFTKDVDALSTSERDNPENAHLWDRMISILYPEPRQKVTEKKKAEYEQLVEKQEKLLASIREKKNPIEEEYLQLIKRKEDLEERKQAALNQIESLGQ